MHIRNGIVTVDVTGFTRDQYIRKEGPPVESIAPPDNLVGWWDFTNKADSQIQNGAVDGSGTACTNGDRIHYIKNLSNSANKIGNFLRAYTDSTNQAPTFKTGGCNGHSYAHFDGVTSGVGERLFATAGGGSNGIAYGGVGASSLSSATLNSQNQTMFFVFKPTDLDPNSGNDSVMYLHKTYDGGSNFSWDEMIIRASDDQIGFRLRYSAASNANLDSGVTPLSEEQIWSVEIGGGTNGFKIYQNGDQSVGGAQTIPSGNDYTLASVGSRIALGVNIANETGSSTYPSSIWSGHLYEIIIYDVLLSETEITNVNNYLLNKYACINEDPVNPTISNHVGWWDFTDAATVFSNVAGTSALAGQTSGYLGYVANKAAGDSGNKLGRFNRTASDSDSYKPKWETVGGQNGQPHAVFSGSARALIAGYFTGENADTFGGASTTQFSALNMTSQNTTMIFVMKSDSTGDITSDENLFGMHAQVSGSTDIAYTRYWKEADTENGKGSFVNSGAGQEEVETSSDLTNDSHIIILHGDSGTNGFKYYQDGVLMDQETLDTNYSFDFTGTNSGTGYPNVIIGSAGFNPTTSGSVNREWDGKIYEIHVYNKTLSTAELNEMLDYLGPKYAIATTVIT